VLVGRMDVMRDMVENSKRTVRHTGLLRFFEKMQKRLQIEINEA